MAFDYYDVQAAANSRGQAQITPEERQMNRTRRLISAAENTNYDGDPEYYQQIKGLALQAGIPIKSFRTNPFRLAKTGLLSALDSALFGIIPNDMYTPMNEAERSAAAIGGIGGALLPWGLPMRTLRAAGAGLGASKWVASGPGKKAWDAFLGRTTSKVDDVADLAKNKKIMQEANDRTVQAITGKKPKSGWKPDPEAPGIVPGANVLDDMVSGANAGKVGKINPVKTKKSAKLSERARQNRATDLGGGGSGVNKPKVTTSGPKPKGGDSGFSFKMNSQGRPSKGEIAKIKAIMTKAEKTSLKKMKGKAKTAFLKQWAKTHGHKIVSV